MYSTAHILKWRQPPPVKRRLGGWQRWRHHCGPSAPASAWQRWVCD